MSGSRTTAVITFLIFAGVMAPAIADEGAEFSPRLKPTINVSLKGGEIKIDGYINDPGWKTAAIADGFTEFTPGDMIRPAVATKVLMTYDRSNLYVAFICSDKGSEVRASLRERDNIFRDDYCGILLDTYGDQSWGYEIFVNPYGIQGDLRQLADGNEDETFDIIFESVGQVTDSGYQVEIAIPFASLRFPNKPEQNWRIDFWRDRQRESRYRYAWGAIDRDDPCFMCQWGYVTGIADIKPSTNLEILPSFIGFQSGSLSDPDNPASKFDNTDPDGDVSLGIRYGITPNSSVEIALNPDFSQVESDAGQIDVNTNYGLEFPERRPFFQEGSDLLHTEIDAVYTRTINDPDVAARLTGQFGAYSLAYLAAYDQNTPILVPLSERSIDLQADEAVANIFRVRRAFGNNSYLGILATHRQLRDFTFDYLDTMDVAHSIDIAGGSGSLYSLDGAFRFLTNYQFNFQVIGSHTEEPGTGKPDTVELIDGSGATFDHGRHTVELDGESFDGNAAYLMLRRSGRVWSSELHYFEYSPTFRTDNGFTTRNDTRTLEYWNVLQFRPNREWLVAWQPMLTVGRVWDYDGTINLDPGVFADGARDEWLLPEISFTLKGQTEVDISYLWSREMYAGRVFPGIRRWAFSFGSRFSEHVAVEASTQLGMLIRRSRSSPELGNYFGQAVGVGIKPTTRLYISTTFEYAKMDHRDTYFEVHPDAEKEIYSGYILRSRITYQFTREWYLRLVLQYDDFNEVFDIEPLLTWQLNPFTVFYIGMTGRYQYFNIDNYEPDERIFDKSEWELDSRQFFAKLQYLFRV